MAGQTEIKDIKTAVIVGAGNVAWHLGQVLSQNGIRILQVINRTFSKGKAMADSLGTTCTSSPGDVDENADLVILAVTDDMIGNVACSLGFIKKGLLVHTAGAVPMDILSVSAASYGVLYPLQTFTAGRQVNFKEIPLLIEASDTKSLMMLNQLAGRISDRVFPISTENRMILHLAAVLTSNFTNHLLLLAEKLLSENEISLGLLKPLMTETLEKSFELGPADAQTGPASRGNLEIIRKHLKMLENNPGTREIYNLLSESILKVYNKKISSN